MALGMLRLAWWQWQRHNDKQVYVVTMGERLAAEPVPITELLATLNARESASEATNQEDLKKWETLNYRRALVSGEYDFENEIVLRNRRLDGAPGVYVLTPLKITEVKTSANSPTIGSANSARLLVTRGFVPLSVSHPDKRKEFQTPKNIELTVLLKTPLARKMFSPEDEKNGPGILRLDQWLRVNPAAVERQVPYPLLPIYAEIMSAGNLKETENKIVRTEKGREELLFLGFREQNVGLPDVRPGLVYPVPVYDAVIPPGRHFGYVYEWSFMAISTLLMGLVIQLRPGKHKPRFQGS